MAFKKSEAAKDGFSALWVLVNAVTGGIPEKLFELAAEARERDEAKEADAASSARAETPHEIAVTSSEVVPEKVEPPTTSDLHRAQVKAFVEARGGKLKD